MSCCPIIVAIRIDATDESQSQLSRFILDVGQMCEISNTDMMARGNITEVYDNYFEWIDFKWADKLDLIYVEVTDVECIHQKYEASSGVLTTRLIDKMTEPDRASVFCDDWNI